MSDVCQPRETSPCSRATSRILTTHAGSLPRPPALAELHGRRSRGEAVDAAELRPAVAAGDRATSSRRRSTAGIDIGNDGEQARESFFTYVQHRMTGFGGTSQRPLMRDLADHPDFLELALPRLRADEGEPHGARRRRSATSPTATRPSSTPSARSSPTRRFAETFMTAASPGIVASAMENRTTPSREEYVRAVAAALRTEYRVIVERGLLLQIDAPDLAMERHTLFADRPLAEFLDWVELVVDAINDALAGIDPGARAPARLLGQLRRPAHPRRRRSTTSCPLLYEAQVGALVLSMANARHAHEYHVLRAPTAARRHGRSSPASSTRRATTSSTRRWSPTASSASPWPSATRAGSSRRPTAASTPPPASATSRRRSCGRSCARCRRGRPGERSPVLNPRRRRPLRFRRLLLAVARQSVLRAPAAQMRRHQS